MFIYFFVLSLTYQTITNKLLNKMTTTTITEIVAIENTDIEFVCEGRLYQLEIGEDEWAALSPTIRNYYADSLASFRNCKKTTPIDLLEICYDLRLYAEDVTETTDKGQSMLRRQSRKSLLSYIVTSANKMRSTLKSMSLAMHTAWTKARIIASGFVQFVKVSDVDSEGEIEIQSRKVGSLSDYGIKGLGNKPSSILRFIDLGKIEKGFHPVSCVISLYVWQVVGWNRVWLV